MTAQHAPRPVLVGIDGSPSGLEALALGSALCVLSGTPLLLTAVYGHQSGGVDVPGPAFPSRATANEWLRQAEEQCGDQIPWHSVSVRATTPARGLLEAAELEGATVMVLGSSHQGAVGRVLAGTTARQVVHRAPCAVAVVPHGWSLRPETEPVTIGVAVDGSPESKEALTVAARLAEPGHARLKVLHAVHLMSAAHPYFAATGTSYAGYVDYELAYGRRIARETSDAVLPGQEVDVEVLSGDCVERLAEASASLDLLVLGSRGYGPVRTSMAGSVSLPLIERAHCAVLIAPRGVHSTLSQVEAEQSPASV